MELPGLFAHLQMRESSPAPHPSADLLPLRAACDALLRPSAVEDAAEAAAASAAAVGPIPEELAGAVELLARALLAPPEDAFADLGGAPRRPRGEWAAAHWEAAALRLRLLAALVRRLGRAELEAPAASGGGGGGGGDGSESDERRRVAAQYDASGRRRAPPVVGIVEVVASSDDGEEGGGDEKGAAGGGGAAKLAALKRRRRAAKLAGDALEVAALYAAPAGVAAAEGAKAAAHSSSGGGGGHGASGGGRKGGPEDADGGIVTSPLLLALARDAERRSLALPTPWADARAAALAGELLDAVLATVGAPAVGASTGAPGAEPAGERRAALLAAAAEQWLLPRLRDPLFAPHRHTAAQERGATEAYAGPGPFERALAARKLAWAARSLGAAAASSSLPPSAAPSSSPLLTPSVLGALLPLALAASDDAAPPVARLGRAALHAAAAAAPRGALAPQRELLLAHAARVVVGCDAAAWTSALPAATALVLAVEPRDDPRAEGVHALLRELLTEAERGGPPRAPRQAAALLGCLSRLLPRARLYAARHAARLFPLLLEWALAAEPRAAAGALACLEALLRATWPRAGAHAGAVWRHLAVAARGRERLAWRRERPRSVDAVDVDDDESGSDADDSGQQSAGEAELAEALLRVGRLLVEVCGREALLAECGGGGSGSSGADDNGGEQTLEAALLDLLKA